MSDNTYNSAILWLFVKDTSVPEGGEVEVLDNYRTDWEEDKITWNNAPVVSPNIIIFTTFTTKINYWHGVNVTEIINLYKGKEVTIALTGMSNNIYVKLCSKEGDNAPWIEVT